MGMTNETMRLRLRAKRRKLNLTLAQVARRVGVSIASVSAWERGERFPKVSHARVWVRAVR